MMRKAFMAAGCYGDTARGIQEKDIRGGGLPDRIVIVRSGPDGNNPPGLYKLAQACLDTGYDVTPLMIWRKSDFAISGHTKHYGLTREEARQYREFFTRLGYELAAWLGTPLVVIPYEPFVTSAEVRAFFFQSLGLVAPAMEFFNANEKYELEGPPLPF